MSYGDYQSINVVINALYDAIMFRFSFLSHHTALNKLREQDVAIFSKVFKVSSIAMTKNSVLAGPVISATGT